jgi:hypothetical protein
MVSGPETRRDGPEGTFATPKKMTAAASETDDDVAAAVH